MADKKKDEQLIIANDLMRAAILTANDEHVSNGACSSKCAFAEPFTDCIEEVDEIARALWEGLQAGGHSMLNPRSFCMTFMLQGIHIGWQLSRLHDAQAAPADAVVAAAPDLTLLN